MLIGIDANEANVPKRVGVGRYASEVIKHLYTLRQSSFSQKNISYVIYTKNEIAADFPKKVDWWQYERVGPRFLWTQIGLPYALWTTRKKPDVFFSPTHYGPRYAPCPRVVSIMDLAYLYYPEYFKKSDLYQLYYWTEYSINKAQKILTISESTKKDIADFFSVKSDNITVTYPGYDTKLFHPRKSDKAITRVRKKFNITKKYILYVGTLQPRKNINRLIEAFNLLIRDPSYARRFDTENLQLVIAGKKGWLYDGIFMRVKHLRLDNHIVFTGFFNDEDLPSLYHDAECFILPSLYEGFGLPVVEAMACGCPVIVSSASSLPEIVGNTGIQIDPLQEEDIADAMLKYLTNQAFRQDTIKKGMDRVKLFSWQSCAQETFNVLSSF